MKTEQITVSLEELKPPKTNVRRHTPRQMREYERSVQQSGQMRPIVIDENNVILAGNGLAQAMRNLGIEEAVCWQVTDFTESQKIKFMLADNRIFNLGDDDPYALENLLGQLDGDIDIPGYDEDLLKALSASPLQVNAEVMSYGNSIVDSKGVSVDVAEIPKVASPVAGGVPSTPTREEYVARHAAVETRTVTCPHCGESFEVS